MQAGFSSGRAVSRVLAPAAVPGAEGFRQAIVDAGFAAPHDIVPGKIHRFPGLGKRPGNRAAWCYLFPDGQGGAYGDFSSDLSES